MTQPASALPTRRHVLLQAAGDRNPLFIFPGISGNPHTYLDLATRLGTDRPVYGFHLVGSLQECEPVRQVRRLAQLYAADVRSVQTRGPYFLFGYSFGGVLAFEVARELMSHGEPIGLVTMADCPAPGYPKLPAATQRMKLHVQNLWQLSRTERVAYLRDRMNNGMMKLQSLVGARNIAENGDGTSPHLQRVNAALHEAYIHYVPAPLSVDVLFLTADAPADWPTVVFDDPLMGWGPVLRGRISQCGIPGAHLKIFDPENVTILAERVSNAISQAERFSELATPQIGPPSVRPTS
jgi:oxalate---CoA ligase